MREAMEVCYSLTYQTFTDPICVKRGDMIGYKQAEPHAKLIMALVKQVTPNRITV